MVIRPFEIHVTDSALVDLQSRLARTRLPDAVANAGWRYGTDRDFLCELVLYWREHFDWRAAEERLNQFPHFLAEIEGLDIHFLHIRGKGPDPLPLVITHGWPSSVAEFATIIPLLTDPAAHGGRVEDSFDVIAPSLPGFGFSEAPKQRGMSSRAVTDIWVRLMKDVLGYERYFAHGGDIGGGITNRLGRWKSATAIHTMVAAPVEHPDSPSASEAEKSWLAYVQKWENDEGGYWHQQRTRPQTLACALNDSPAGLAAWIVEKWRSWSDCAGDVLSRFSLDELLTNISVYWFTETIGSSMRIYYESGHDPNPEIAAKIEVPARIFLTREEVDLCPPEYAARSYTDFSYGIAERGGHFLAAEEPALLADDIRNWFRRFR